MHAPSFADPRPSITLSGTRVSRNDETSTGAESGAPDTLGRFELLTSFATGGMAELFLARERGVAGLERVVVIKRLLPHLTDDPESIEMFLREARLVARLNHPNVVQTYELGEEHGDYFLAMEYLHGSTLRELQRLTDRDGLPLPIAVSAIEQASRGLHAAHELRDLEGNPVELIHRDVSPQNLMLTDEGYVKLLDFGVAKAAEGKEATYSGHIKGKFSYMSPEQLHREPLDRRSDIFALGIVTWELLAGERLFDRDGELETMTAITEEKAPPPSAHKPAVPPELDEVVARALAKDRQDRYSTAEQMRRDLAELAERHDLSRDEADLAEFVESTAGDQLDARRETLHEALDGSLTADERARLRHERGVRSANRAGREDGATTVETPGSASNAAPASNPKNSPRRARADRGSTSSDLPVQDDASGTRRATRWQIGLTGAAVVLLFATAALTFWDRTGGESVEPDPEATAEPSGPPLTLVMPPFVTEKILNDDMGPIVDYLEPRLERPIELSVAASYGDASRKLREGEVDLGLLTPLLFIRTRRAAPDVQPVVVREFGGSPTSDGMLLVPSDADHQTLADLEGATFCLTDKNSTTGNFLPRVYIRRQGWRPERFIGEVQWSGNHLQVMRDLVDDHCDVAATYSGAFVAAGEHGIPVGQFRTLAITGHSPSDTITARPGLSRELFERLQRLLLDFDPRKHAGTSKVGETLQITGFQRPREEIYRDLADAVDAHLDILARFDFPGVDELARDAGLPAAPDAGSAPPPETGLDSGG